MVLRKFKYLIISIFLLLSCSASQSSYIQENYIDASGIKRSVIVYRLFVGGKLQENMFDSYYSGFPKTSTNYQKILCADLVVGAISTYSYTRGQHSGYDGNRLDIVFNEKAMVLYFDKKTIGKNIYIDSIPFKSGRFYLSSSIKLDKVISLKKKYKRFKKMDKVDELISKQWQIRFRRHFALDTASNKNALDELFGKVFYEIEFNDLEKQ